MRRKKDIDKEYEYSTEANDSTSTDDLVNQFPEDTSDMSDDELEYSDDASDDLGEEDKDEEGDAVSETETISGLLPKGKKKITFTTDEAIAIMKMYNAGKKECEKVAPILKVMLSVDGTEVNLPNKLIDSIPDTVDKEELSYVKDLVNKYNSGMQKQLKAKEDMISKLSLFIYDTISKHFSTFTAYITDLYDEAVIGILKGLDSYDPKISKPSTFFRIYMIHEITEFINSHFNKTTSHYAARIMTVKKAMVKLRKDGSEPTPKEISQETGISPETVIQALKINDMKNEVHYDAPEYIDQNISQSIKSPEAAYIEKETSETIYKAIATLTPDEQEVIILKYGLDDSSQLAYKTISQKTGISIDMVKKLHNRALRKLRKDKQMRKSFSNKLKEEKILNEGHVGIIPRAVGEDIADDLDNIPLEAI